jgi:Mn-dependent DtxR family transcriptional regulator
MILQESGEMYLESIYILTKEKKNVRSIDIVDYMNFSKPSVSRAVGLLKNGGYITVDKDGYITLTEAGTDVAQKIYERHKIISAFLTHIGVSEITAGEDACKIEHVISDESFNAIKKLMEDKK